ncbi:MAG: O-acetylhomoserine aminocarboxypropyltransferase/cysteine synthase [Spirochaetaceae bacterium]|nr:O-acetylhomoserine aminocarboxypropyltransferase/cysteine synthase [Spirochaetaceae bacterium]
MKFSTKAVHSGYYPTNNSSDNVPIYRTSAYVFDNTDFAADLFSLKKPGNIYSRMMNPTQAVLEERVAALEGGKAALALSSGTSAIFYTIINICKEGDEIISSSKLYGGTYTMLASILPEFGIKTVFVDSNNPENFDKATTSKTKLYFTETIGNPVLDVADIKAISVVAKKNNIPLAVDSTFTTPYIFRPLEYGADIVIHSLTKWIGGHDNGLGGIVVDGGKFDWKDKKFELYNKPDASYNNLMFSSLPETIPPFITRLRVVPLRNLGACISPDSAWLFIQGIATLPLRMDKHCANAMKIAEFLKNHPRVKWVRYPGLKTDPSWDLASKYYNGKFGGMVVFGIDNGLQGGKKFIDSLKLITHVANVGDIKTLAIHPASTTHSQMSEKEQEEAGLMPDLVRLSIGIEDADDIIEDIDQALKNS